VPEEYIVGKAWLSYWPPQLWSVIPDYNVEPGATTGLFGRPLALAPPTLSGH
jgi:hypothetical protein